ncbi:MAG: DUF2341 domain-containing protein, partial [archaeon YNP-WB-040]|nr:DUF2341 domain-containing protein [Candidatus Culexarchaeum yellowstonense]
SWLYRRNITINNTANSNNLIDYQVLVTLDTATLISNGKMNGDCSDIRFTYYNSTGGTETEIPYWIEGGCNSATTKIWVKVPYIPASGYATIYVYYGNPNATSLSNADATFDFFDDFLGTSLNTSKWTVLGSSGATVSVSNSIFTITISTTSGGYYQIRSNIALPFGIIIETRVNAGGVVGTRSLMPAYSTGTGVIRYDNDVSYGSYYAGAYLSNGADNYAGWSFGVRTADGSSTLATKSNFYGSGLGVWLKNRLIVMQGYQQAFIYDDNWNLLAQSASSSNTLPSATYYVDLGNMWYSASGTYSFQYDWVRVRKYTSPEPTTSVGAEETIAPIHISKIVTYDNNLNEKITFYSGDIVRIRTNVTHDNGASYIDKVLITIIDTNNSIVVSNESMTAVSPIDYGYTYEYNYTLPKYVSNGEWKIIVYANDTLGYQTSSSSVFIVYEIFDSSDWKYRTPITINNTQNPNTLTDYQVLVTLDTASLISAGKMRSDCGDIRFTYLNLDGREIEIPYWIESGCNTTSTKIWVKVPNIPASSSTTIYVYYGNSQATSLSNGTATFDFFDDFITYDSTKYLKSGSPLYPNDKPTISVNNGILEVNSTGCTYECYWYTNYNITNSTFIFRVKYIVSTSAYYWTAIGGIQPYGSGWSQDSMRATINTTSSVNSYTTGIYKYTFALTNDTWTTFIFKAYANTNYVFIRNYNTEYTTSSAAVLLAPFSVRVDNRVSYAKVFIDYLAIGKYTSPEPTASVGAEETIAPIISVGSIYTYDIDLNPQTSFSNSSFIIIRTNVTHDNGASYIDKVLITIIDNSSVIQVNNATMVNISSITNGYTYEYNYTLPSSPVRGTWTIKVYANDTSNNWGSNQRT